jgi:hypothetical protein
MIVAIFRRRLREGATYEEFRERVAVAGGRLAAQDLADQAGGTTKKDRKGGCEDVRLATPTKRTAVKRHGDQRKGQASQRLIAATASTIPEVLSFSAECHKTVELSSDGGSIADICGDLSIRGK